MLTASLENSCYTERRNILSVTQNRMKQVLGKLSRGSILAYSLILLGIVLVASIGMMSASVTNLKSVSSSDKSINAFQIADSGSQAVVRMLKEAAGNELRDISGVTCDGSDAVVESPANFLGGKYKAIFQDSDGKTLACNDNISAVASVKSVGTYSDTARAVQVAVAAGGCPATGGLVLAGSSSNQNGFDFSNLMTYIDSGNARVAEGRCGWGGSKSSFSDSYTLSSGSVLMGNGGSSTVMTCSGSKCSVSGGGSADCTGGWRIYVECPVL